MSTESRRMTDFWPREYSIGNILARFVDLCALDCRTGSGERETTS